MLPRSLVVATTSLVLFVAACGAVPTAAPAAAPSVQAPVGTPVPVATDSSGSPGSPFATPVIGDVDGTHRGPELTIEPVGDGTIRVTLDDPGAKAWRLVVTGTGELGGDRWEIAVESGDTGPLISATEIVDGEVLDVMDLSGFADGTAAAGGCHSRLPVCLGSDGFRLPRDGDGQFSIQLQLPDAHTPLVVRGATAAWEGEPFALGPWHETDAFPWGEG